MAKDTQIGIRLEEAEREALSRAAAADERPASALARKVLVDWLKRNGWLKAGKN